VNRRDFIKKVSILGLGTILIPNTTLSNPSLFQKGKKIRIGLIGVGLRGRSSLNLLLKRNDVIIHSICDIDENAIELSKELCKKHNKTQPKVFQKHEKSYQDLLEEKKIDGVIISTPWRWHFKMAIDAMKARKYVGMEVGGASSIQECWDLVNTHEETGTHLFVLENVCYRRDVMAVLNMVRKNIFGELIHLECGYQHDLRFVKFNDGKEVYAPGAEFGEKALSEAKWRTQHSIDRNGDLYPTHGFGPVAQMLNINTGNQCDYLTSTATKSRGLHEYIVKQGGKNHPNADIEFKLGDVVTTVIKTFNGETITLKHDTNLPRPYSLGFRVQGTNGIWMDINNSIFIENKSPLHNWESDEKYIKEYDHPLWKKYEHLAEGAGHGGMDWFIINDFVESVKNNTPAPLDVYDCATMRVITPLSENSIKNESSPQKFPDFTKGKWKSRINKFAIKNNF
tara:strand:+ start:2692 stop:4050 length:1359 start_codon:yes stop_codon:yes gene_type:complete